MFAPLLLLAALVAAPPAQAFEWTGTEYTASLGVDLPGKGRTGFRASVHQFGVPEAGKNMRFAYAGPKIAITPNLWIAPQAGVMSGWMADGSDAAIASLWGGFTHRHVSVFVEGDGYFSPGQLIDIYTYVAVDRNGDVVNVGLNYEGVNATVVIGPHIGATKGAFHVEVQGYMKPDFSTGTVRAVTAVTF